MAVRKEFTCRKAKNRKRKRKKNVQIKKLNKIKERDKYQKGKR